MLDDGRSADEIQQILSPGAAHLINASGSGIFTLTVEPQSWFVIQRFTDPKTGQPSALPVGNKWVQDFGGTVIGQSVNQVQVRLPNTSLSDLASLPMVKYVYAPMPNAADIKMKQLPSQIMPSIKNFLTQQQWGFPVWSWLAIAGGLGMIWFGIRKRKT
jgi:hypothetical protein